MHEILQLPPHTLFGVFTLSALNISTIILFFWGIKRCGAELFPVRNIFHRKFQFLKICCFIKLIVINAWKGCCNHQSDRELTSKAMSYCCNFHGQELRCHR